MPSPPAAKIHQKILLVGLGLALAFLLVEVSLQAAASVRRLGASPAASIRPDLPHDGAYRILCLGESTTAPFYGVASYVEILEQLLNQRGFGVRFDLINSGYVDQHTSFLVQKLPEVERHPEAEYFHRKLAGVYAELGERALADEYFRRSNSLAQRYVLSVTRANYQTAECRRCRRGRSPAYPRRRGHLDGL